MAIKTEEKRLVLIHAVESTCCSYGNFCCCIAVVAYLFLFRVEELGMKEVLKYVKYQNVHKMYKVRLLSAFNCPTFVYFYT